MEKYEDGAVYISKDGYLRIESGDWDDLLRIRISGKKLDGTTAVDCCDIYPGKTMSGIVEIAQYSGYFGLVSIESMSETEVIRKSFHFIVPEDSECDAWSGLLTDEAYPVCDTNFVLRVEGEKNGIVLEDGSVYEIVTPDNGAVFSGYRTSDLDIEVITDGVEESALVEISDQETGEVLYRRNVEFEEKTAWTWVRACDPESMSEDWYVYSENGEYVYYQPNKYLGRNTPPVSM